MAEQLDGRGEPKTATHGADRTTFSARETRQAGMGARVFLVLAASLFLALLVWGFVEWGHRGEQTGQPASSQQQQPDAEVRPSTESPQGMAPAERAPNPQ